MDIYYTVVMTLNALCALMIFLSGMQQQRGYDVFCLVLLNIVSFFFHYYSWHIHSSTNLADAISYSRMHNALILISIPLVIATLTKWVNFKYNKQINWLFFTLTFILLILNGYYENSIRYGDNVELINYVSFFGENLVLIHGSDNDISSLTQSVVLLATLLLLYTSFRLFREQKNFLAFILLVLLLLQLICTYIGYKIDHMQLPLFYIGGLPITIFSILCMAFMSMSYREKMLELASERDGKLKLQQAMTKLAEGISSIDPTLFYKEMAKILYDFSKADYVIIGEIQTREKTYIDMLVGLKNGETHPNFSYVIDGTPCEQVASNNICIYCDEVASLFPTDAMLEQEKISSYVGVSLVDEMEQPIGVLSLLYHQAYDPPIEVMNALKVFASRAGSEMRRNRLEQRLKKMAYYDYESNLPNRSKLLEVINEQYFECKKNNTNALFLLVDLDRFGDINRKYGDTVGDEVIKQLALRLRHYSSKDKFIARNSGDEFAVVLSNVTEDEDITSYLNVHWQALKAIISEPCIVGERRIHVSCSVGAVLFPAQIANHFDVISSAEHAIGIAKESGRNNYALFDPAILAKKDQQKEIEVDLAKALTSEDQLYIVYQAKVDHHGAVIGSEALIRWEHPTRGFMPPPSFIGIAEESGLIHSLGKWVTSQVCQQIRQWLDEGKPVHKVSINIAAMQFDNPDFINFIFKTLKKYRLAPHYIEIELTESGLLTDINRAIENLNKLRQFGISIALDDFGTGYSSLSYLQDLPLDVLKIDKSFVDNLDHEKSAELVRSIISIGNHMNLKTVAEGTETLEQVNALKAMGCDYFQGYYFCKPVRPNEFMNYSLEQ